MNTSHHVRFAYFGLSRCLQHSGLLTNTDYDWGLTATQSQALRLVAWLPRQRAKACGELHLGFAYGPPLPRHVRLPDGAFLPVNAIRTDAGELHGALIGNAARDSGNGTLTALLRGRDNQRLYALTAGHVLAAADDTQVGDRITVWRRESSLRDATLEHWMPGFHSGPRETRVDAGIARIGAAHASALIEEDLVLPKGVVGINLQRSLTVETCSDSGPITALPEGFASVWMSLAGMTGALDYRIIDVLVFTTQQTALMPGDSGSPIMEQEHLAGMYIGSAPLGLVNDAEWAGLAVPMVRILDWCKSDLVLSPADLHPPEKTGALTPSPSPLTESSPELTLARTVWGEASGEGRDGMAAVANVVMNRVSRPRYWGRSVIEVCRKPYQFSCWNSGDPNLVRLQKLSGADLAQPLALARAAIAMQLPDITNGATHYYARTMAKPPRWAENHHPCAVIGNHSFYNDIA